MSTYSSKIWWEHPRDEIHNAVFAVTNQIQSNESGRQELLIEHAKAYGNREYTSLFPDSAATTPWHARDFDQVSYNVTKSAIDSLTSKIAKNKPKVYFNTDDGSFDQQERAKGLNRYIAGEFHKQKAYKLGEQVFRDAAVFGTGCIKAYYDDLSRRVLIERVHIKDILIDEFEGESPKQIHQRKWLDQYTLSKLFPEFEDMVQATEPGSIFHPMMSDRLEVIESWYAGIPGIVTGKHTICIRSVCLFEEEWNTTLPFRFFHFNESLNGFYGTSLAFELQGNQRIINQTLESITVGQKLFCVPRYFVDKSTKFLDDESSGLNNEIGQVVVVDGEMPTAQTNTAFTPEVYNFLESTYRKTFEISGVSLMSATSKIPAGLESGVAMQTYNDLETERFATTAESYQNLYLDLADLMIELSKKNFTKKTRVAQKDDRFFSSSFWGDIDMDRDMFAIQSWSTNILPDTPAGKLQMITDLAKGGLMQPEQVLELLDFPDLRKAVSYETASRRLAEKRCNEIIMHGKYTPPDMYMNLEILAQVSKNTYELALLNDDTDPNNIELLIQFMDEIANLATKKNLPPPPEGMAPPPPEMPMPPEGMPPMPPLEGVPGELPPIDPSLLPPQ